jgi:hypothetical protein
MKLKWRHLIFPATFRWTARKCYTSERRVPRSPIDFPSPKVNSSPTNHSEKNATKFALLHHDAKFPCFSHQCASFVNSVFRVHFFASFLIVHISRGGDVISTPILGKWKLCKYIQIGRRWYQQIVHKQSKPEFVNSLCYRNNGLEILYTWEHLWIDCL